MSRSEPHAITDHATDESAFQLAGKATRTLLHSTIFVLFDVVVSAVFMVIGSQLGLLTGALSFLGSFAGFVALAFCWHLVRAPYLQRDEAREEVKRIRVKPFEIPPGMISLR